MAERPETMPATNAVALLLRQHEEIRRLCRRVEANTGRRREEAFESLRRLLAVHETAEEQVVHPIVRRIAPNGDRIVDRLLEEEKRGKTMLRDLERMGTHDPSFPPMFARLRAEVLQHAEREEREEFPVLKPARSRGTARAGRRHQGGRGHGAHASAPRRGVGEEQHDLRCLRLGGRPCP